MEPRCEIAKSRDRRACQQFTSPGKQTKIQEWSSSSRFIYISPPIPFLHINFYEFYNKFSLACWIGRALCEIDSRVNGVSKRVKVVSTGSSPKRERCPGIHSAGIQKESSTDIQGASSASSHPIPAPSQSRAPRYLLASFSLKLLSRTPLSNSSLARTTAMQSSGYHAKLSHELWRFLLRFQCSFLSSFENKGKNWSESIYLARSKNIDDNAVWSLPWLALSSYSLSSFLRTDYSSLKGSPGEPLDWTFREGL